MLRWAGGKQKYLDSIIPKITSLIKNPMINNNIYYEPFLGSGAVLIELLKHDVHFDKYVCSDINRNLIITFNQVKSNVDELLEELIKIENIWNLLDNGRKELFYYTKRDEYNDIIESDEDLKIATLFIFLNRTSFRGLYQVNKRGKYNVPYGKKEHLRIVHEEKMRYLSDLFNEFNVDFQNCQYGDILRDLSEKEDCNKVIYLDPPYYNTKMIYTKKEFDFDQLINFLEQTTYVLNTNVILSNSIDFKRDVIDLFNNIEEISCKEGMSRTDGKAKRVDILCW